MSQPLPITPFSTATSGSINARPLPAGAGRFAEALREAMPEPAAMSISLPGLGPTPKARVGEADLTADQAAETAREFVSMSLVQPILAQLRKTSAAWGPFAPGKHEQQFGPLIDAEVAMRITRASNFPIVDAVTRSLMDHAETAKQTAQETAR